METNEIVIGQELTVGGPGWGERGEVMWIHKYVIAMKNLDTGVEFEVDKAGISWVYEHPAA